MPMLLTFIFTKWVRKEHGTIKVVFDNDGKEDDLDLHYVFVVAGRFEWRSSQGDGGVPRRSALPRLREAAMREAGARAGRRSQTKRAAPRRGALRSLHAASEPDLWALSNATITACIVPMVSGLDWVGLDGSGAAVGVN
jgi:hypothetical protein